MLVQIYSLTAPADVDALVDLGVDHFGVAAGEQDVPARVSIERARALFDRVPEDRRTVALTVRTEPEAILGLAEALRPDVLHVCSDTEAVGVAETAELREALPAGTELMKAIDVAGPEAVALAERYAPVSDWLLLDTAAPDVPGVGASGETHDWSVSAEIVEAVDAPVILAGGLGPDNVAEAVRTVRPAGVDSYTRTSRTERRKDLEKVRRFAEAARAAAGGQP